MWSPEGARASGDRPPPPPPPTWRADQPSSRARPRPGVPTNQGPGPDPDLARRPPSSDRSSIIEPRSIAFPSMPHGSRASGGGVQKRQAKRDTLTAPSDRATCTRCRQPLPASRASHTPGSDRHERHGLESEDWIELQISKDSLSDQGALLTAAINKASHRNKSPRSQERRVGGPHPPHPHPPPQNLQERGEG